MGDAAIVGAGLAGATTALALRRNGFTKPIHLIGDEVGTPYDRPALSKAVLAGDADHPPTIVDAAVLASQGINFIPGCRALAVSEAGIRLEGHPLLAASVVILATGARARKLAVPGAELTRVFELRSLADAHALRAAIWPGCRLAVIGGGLIGCEVASAAAKLGAEVRIFEAQDELVSRILGPVVGLWCQRKLASLGVDILCGAAIKRIEGVEHVTGVRLSDGRRFAADLVLVSIGAVPNDELARAAGITCTRGVVVDATGGSSVSWLYAVGDVAHWPLIGGSSRPLETYLNTVAQAEVTAEAIVGKPRSAPQRPLGWTEIGGHHIQVVGDLAGSDTLSLHGDPDSDQFIAFRSRAGRVEAAVAVGSPRDFAAIRRLIDSNSDVSPEVLLNGGKRAQITLSGLPV